MSGERSRTPGEALVSTAHLAAARRTPVQERSAVRVERMLDAAAHLLARTGTEGLTTSSVAREAGVSVGSLYQFFPDLSAVLRALAQRSFDRYRAALADRLAVAPPQRWEHLVEAVVDGYVEFARSEPAFRLLNLGGPLRAEAAGGHDNGLVAVALGDVLLDVLPGVDRSPRLELALRVAVESGEAVLALAFRRAPEGDPVLVAELKRFLVAGLSDLLATPASRLPG